MLAEIDDLVLVREQVARRVRQENLPTVAGGGDPGRTVHVHSDVALVRQQRLARVDAHPHGDAVLLKKSLRVAGRGRRVARTAEGDEEGVALGVDLDAVVRLPRLAQGRAVELQLSGVRRRPELAEQRRRTFDVREEKGDRARRARRHEQRIAALRDPGKRRRRGSGRERGLRLGRRSDRVAALG